MFQCMKCNEMEEYEKKHAKGATFKQTKFWRVLFIVLAVLSAVLAIVAKLALESQTLMMIFFCIMIAFCIGIWVVIIKERI